METKNIIIGISLLSLMISLGFNTTDFDMIDENPTHQCISENFKAFLNCDEGITSSKLTCKRSFGTDKRCSTLWSEIEYPIDEPINSKSIKYTCNTQGCTEI